jgi:hypothetical protein
LKEEEAPMTANKVVTLYRETSSHRKDRPALQEVVQLPGIRSSDIPHREAIHRGATHHSQGSHNGHRVSEHRRDIRNSSTHEAINLGRIRHIRNPDSHNHVYNSRRRTNGVAPVRRDILRNKVVIPHRVATLLAKDSMDKASKPKAPQVSKANGPQASKAKAPLASKAKAPQASKAKAPQANKANFKLAKTTTRHPLTHGFTLAWDPNIEVAVWLTAK